MKVLVTGGAGFIGSFLTDELIRKGHRVTVFDNLEPQIHHGKKPSYLNPKARFVKADITDPQPLDVVLRDIDIIFHEAAMIGVGQSMYQIGKYTKVNTYGTALLLDLVVNKHRNHIKKIIVAASMSEYGEGLYRCEKCGNIKPLLRKESQLEKQQWEVSCPNCNLILRPKPTPETTPLECNSIYALNKRDQEDMSLTIGKTYKIPTVALRYFNVYGPRQSLSNPYTGVAAIFISRIKAGKSPVVFEDGKQSRDFISVHDIVSANISVMADKRADYQTFNVGSGKKITITALADLILKTMKSKIPIRIENRFRKGDIRHCFANIKKITKTLGWSPKTSREQGMKELIDWSINADSKDFFDEARQILQQKGVL
ncbi:GDP-mannose 4,6-dehydratase [Candidatus Roizmanbacteria bacterium]|nr:GDP-mannose 4,6-dehydratase [Candidatus Roizmanbacteria bacterium]